MANFTQDRFTAGELDPRLYYRVGWDGYAKAAKKLRNVIVVPQGGAQRRFGMRFAADITADVAGNASNYELQAYTYDSDTVYLLAFTPLKISIYLQNVLQDTVTTTYTAADIPNIRITQIKNKIQIVCGRIVPRLLSRGAGSTYNITSVDTANDYIITSWGAGVIGGVYPVVFGGSAVPTGVPQIVAGQTYYVRVFSTTTAAMRIYASADDAGNNVNWFTLATAGTSATVTLQNDFTIADMAYKFLPAYDFTNNYSALTFTPSAATGSVTLTASGAVFTAAYVGGLFTGGGGIMRITAYSSATVVSGYTLQDFTGTSAINGALCLLGEPAWSDARGWPSACSFYQNRSVMGGTRSIQDGEWLSAINDVTDFDDSFADDDYAISYYPAAGNSSYISAFTSARSLLAHTNTGSYSTPLNDSALTPRSITMTQQNKDGVSTIAPIFIDNQILYVDKSVNNVKSMVWEISQSSYVLNNASIVSSHLIRNPIDMIGYSNPKFVDGSYAFVVNEDGTFATLQTLSEQNIQAWTINDTNNTYENSEVLAENTRVNKVASALDHLWFGVNRVQFTYFGSNKAITGFSSSDNTFTIAPGFTLSDFNLMQFTAGSPANLPTTVPQIAEDRYYFTYRFEDSLDTFQVFTSYEDALNQTNPILITNAGTSAEVMPYFSTQKYYIEELDFEIYTDCSKLYKDVNSNTLTGLEFLEAEMIWPVGDGIAFPPQVVTNGQITLPQSVTNASAGLQYISEVTLLPVNLVGQNGNTIYTPSHIRALYINFYQTVGATVNGLEIPMTGTEPFILGATPLPDNFVTPSVGVMLGWDNTVDLTIQQIYPYPMTVLGLSYEVIT